MQPERRIHRCYTHERFNKVQQNSAKLSAELNGVQQSLAEFNKN